MTTKESEKPEESKDQKESKNNKTIFCLATRKKMENYTGGTIELLLSGDIQTGATRASNGGWRNGSGALRH